MMMTVEPSDSEREQLSGWLSAAATGDRRAFEALYRRTSAKLFGVCLRILGERSVAEEALQDAYLVIWNKAGSYDPTRASPLTWLAMIARHKAIDRLRGARIERATVPIDLVAALADEGVPVADRLEAVAEGRRLRDCLGELTGEQRVAIRTAFLEGCTYEEFATRSGTPLGTVKSWIRRGLLKLRECLQR